MKRLRIICFLFLTSSFVSCSSKHYKKIDSLANEFNLSNQNRIFIQNMNYNPSKEIFKRLDADLSEDFIYVFSWVNHLPIAGTNHFVALIYDSKTGRKFYINNDKNDKKINITEAKSNYQLFGEEEFILKEYLNGNVGILLSIEQQFSSVEIGSEYFLFDFKSNKAYLFENIVLDEKGNLLMTE